MILFLHPVPMIGALALKPHDKRDDLNVHIGYLDFSLLLVWWVYLYLFVVIPWQYIAPNVLAYGWSYDHLAAVENLLLAGGFAVLITQAKGHWREVYAHLFALPCFTPPVPTSPTARLTGRIITPAAHSTCRWSLPSCGSAQQELWPIA